MWDVVRIVIYIVAIIGLIYDLPKIYQRIKEKQKNTIDKVELIGVILLIISATIMVVRRIILLIS